MAVQRPSLQVHFGPKPQSNLIRIKTPCGLASHDGLPIRYPILSMTAGEHSTQNEEAFHFDARSVSPRFRSAAILGALDVMKSGEVMRLVNDYDPLPLLSQLRQRYGGTLAIGYLKRTPSAVVIDFVMTEDAEERPENCGCCGRCG